MPGGLVTGTAVSQRVDYSGRRFQPIGSVGDPAAAIGYYHQEGDLVWAEFTGPTVRAGRLVGSCDADGVIEAAYCMVTVGGQTAAGRVTTSPTMLPDGRIALTEQWQRMDGTAGVSHLEEVPAQ